MVGMQDPLFFFFPVLESRFLHMFPKRKLIHDDCDRFLNLMDSMIEEKRKIVNKSNSDDKAFISSASGTFAERGRGERQEKDILTLLLESEKDCQDSNVFMTNEELKVLCCCLWEKEIVLV